MIHKNSRKKLLELKDFIIREMPITQHLQFSIDQYDEHGLILSAPLLPNLNHRGTAFGGSISMLAILAGYGMTLLLLEDFCDPYHIVVQNANIAYDAPVQNDFIAICFPPAQKELEIFKNIFTKRGKARLYQHCVIKEKNSGNGAATFDGAYVAITEY